MGQLLLTASLRKLLALLPALLVAAACMTTSSHREMEARLARAETDVERGQVLYEHSCNRCHSLYMPRSYEADEWPFFVRKYGRKARLSEDQRTLVLGYLVRAAEPPPPSLVGPAREE